MHRFKYFLVIIICAACHAASSSPDEVILSKEFEDAIKNKDTVLAQKIAQRELDKSRASITDSSFAALMDATLGLQDLEFKIQKNDSSALDNKYFGKLHSFMISVYGFSLKRSINKSDLDYYATKVSESQEKWIADNFAHKTKKELQIVLLLLQQDVAISSGIINGIDTKEGRQEIEESYANSIKIIKGSN